MSGSLIRLNVCLPDRLYGFGRSWVSAKRFLPGSWVSLVIQRSAGNKAGGHRLVLLCDCWKSPESTLTTLLACRYEFEAGSFSCACRVSALCGCRGPLIFADSKRGQRIVTVDEYANG